MLQENQRPLIMLYLYLDVGCRGRAVFRVIELKFCDLQNVGSKPGLVSCDTCVLEQGILS